MDLAQIATALGALAGLVLGIAGFSTSRRQSKTAAAESKTSASVSYVDTNLRTMQATIEWQAVEDARLRLIIEAQRIELEQVKHKADECTARCEALEARIERMRQP